MAPQRSARKHRGRRRDRCGRFLDDADNLLARPLLDSAIQKLPDGCVFRPAPTRVQCVTRQVSHGLSGDGSDWSFPSMEAPRPFAFQCACAETWRSLAPSSPYRSIGVVRQRSHRGCTVKRGATSQLARNAASILSNVSVCPQQRQVSVGMMSSGEVPVESGCCAVAPLSIMRERLGACRVARGSCPPPAPTEPDLWASHPALRDVGVGRSQSA